MDWSREQIEVGRLDSAVNRAELEEVRAILDEGVDPNIKDIVGDPVIIGAAWIGAPEVVRLLAERGADVNATGHDGKNALQRLLNDDGLWHQGHDQVVALLRELGGQEWVATAITICAFGCSSKPGDYPFHCHARLCLPVPHATAPSNFSPNEQRR